MDKRVRRQHVVSQFYLKGFASEANQLRRIYLPGDRSHLMATSDATVIKDFYTITFPDGSQSDFFERRFAGIEREAAAAFRAALGGSWPLAADDRLALASWIALQHLRSEKVRLSGVEHEAMMYRLIIGVSGKKALRELIEGAEKRSVSDSELDWEWNDLTKSGGPDLMPESDAHLKLLLDMHGGLTRYLFASHWTLMEFRRRALLTTDQPVVMTVGPDYPEWRGVGFATADAFVAALSRRHALVVRPWIDGVPPGHHGPDRKVNGTTAAARWVNQELVGQALRHIYCHPDDELVCDLHLPEPDRPQWNSANADDFVKENGFFHGVSPKAKKALAASKSQDDKNSFSISDVAWPIPRRVTPNRPTSW